MTQTSTKTSTSTENNLHDKLLDIQQNLHVPKTRENEFGGFKYRSIEDIEDKVKPFLKKHKLILTFTDRVYAVGERVYVEATAYLSDGSVSFSTSASAREAEKPKAKTDDAQLTGGCSSYARKYAVAGMFLIDDGKSDPDSPKVDVSATENKLANAKAEVFAVLTDQGVSESAEMIAIIKKVTGNVTIKTIADADKILNYLRGKND